MLNRIILTGASAPGFPSIAHSLGEFWILATDFKPSLSARQIADDFAITPDLVILAEGVKKRYVEFIRSLIDKHNINVVVPIRTQDMQAICGIPLGIPTLSVTDDEEVVSLLNDKYSLLSHAALLGLEMPWFEKTSEFGIMSTLKEKAPFVMKPLVQSGSRGMRVVRRRKHYPFVNDILFKKPAECINITFEQFQRVAWTTDMLVMEHLPGNEYTVDCLCYEGQLVAMVPRRRDKMIGGISGAAEVVKDECYDEMLKVCKKLVEQLCLSYAVGFQFKCNKEGKPRLIECNPRLQGSTCLTVAAGLDIPELAVRLALKEVSPDDIHVDIRWGTKFERTFTEWYE